MSELIKLTPEIGVPYEPNEPPMDLIKRVDAMCATAKDLAACGLDLTVTEDDAEIATILMNAYAEDPAGTSQAVTNRKAAAMRPASLVLANSILSEFGQLVVSNSIQLRNLVTNKLLLETENPDARIRLRAMELLGKISDVGLFTEKREVTVTHTSTEELRASLKNKLTKLVSPDEDVIEGEFSEAEGVPTHVVEDE